MTLLLVATPFVVGLLLGAITPARIALLTVPPLVLAAVYWVAVGWNGDDYDIGRSGLLLLTGFFGAAFVALWVVGSVVGRLFRLGLER